MWARVGRSDGSGPTIGRTPSQIRRTLASHPALGKAAKNRLHLDVAAADPEAEVTRLVELGATRVADVDEFGYTWTVMADPEGKEFCVAKSL